MDLIDIISKHYSIDHINNHCISILIIGDPNIIKDITIDEDKYVIKFTGFDSKLGLTCTTIILANSAIRVQLINNEEMCDTNKIIIVYEPSIRFSDIIELTVKDGVINYWEHSQINSTQLDLTKEKSGSVKMELTRKQVIEILEKADSTVYKEPKTKTAQALEYAIDTIYKYQKIQEIMKSKKMNALNIGLLIPKDMAYVLHEIKEVMGDENDKI